MDDDGDDSLWWLSLSWVVEERYASTLFVVASIVAAVVVGDAGEQHGGCDCCRCAGMTGNASFSWSDEKGSFVNGCGCDSFLVAQLVDWILLVV